MIFYFFPEEVAYMQNYIPNLYEVVKDHIEIKHPHQVIQEQNELRDKLGELASEYGYRVAENSEVSGVRNLGIRPNTVVFDEAHNLSEVFDSGEPSVVTQRWLEHRRVCRRTLLDCLSGEAH